MYLQFSLLGLFIARVYDSESEKIFSPSHLTALAFCLKRSNCRLIQRFHLKYTSPYRLQLFHLNPPLGMADSNPHSASTQTHNPNNIAPIAKVKTQKEC